MSLNLTLNYHQLIACPHFHAYHHFHNVKVGGVERESG